MVVAIATEGAAPILAREIKSRLEALLPANFGALARYAQALRAPIARALPDARARRHLWQRLLQGPFRRAILNGAAQEARRVLAAELQGGACAPSRGRVALIGCGPGDPDLLTLKALQRMQEADVLVVDRLIDPRVLEYARRDAQRILVGTTPHGSTTSQAEINRILVREAGAGKVVARLRCGDPLSLGRACEELAALAAAGIAVDVVPGVTAAHACAARIALPLTLGAGVRQFSFVAGAAEDARDLDWQALARADAAFAVYMGVADAPLLRRKLRAAGARPDRPAVIVENGTLGSERAIATTLEDLADCIGALGIADPAVIFVGLDWSTAGLTRPVHVSSYRRRRRRTLSGDAADVLEVNP